VGFGSCHSLGVAVGLRGYDKSSRLQCGGWIWYEPLFLAASQVLFLSFSPVLFNVRSIVPVDHPLIFFLSEETKLCRFGRHCPRNGKGIGTNVLCLLRAGILKPRPVPRGETKYKN